MLLVPSELHQQLLHLNFGRGVVATNECVVVALSYQGRVDH